MQLEAVSRGASAEALDAGAAAALAVFSKADMDPWRAIQAVSKALHWDELGFPEDEDQLDLDGMPAPTTSVTPSAEDHAAARIYWDAADAAQDAIYALVPSAQRHDVSLGLAQQGDFNERESAFRDRRLAHTCRGRCRRSVRSHPRGRTQRHAQTAAIRRAGRGEFGSVAWSAGHLRNLEARRCADRARGRDRAVLEANAPSAADR